MTSPTRPVLCSAESESVQEGAFGSAAPARFWICLEQNGPWGRVASRESHLDPDLGKTLDLLAAAVGGRFALIRRPGRHPDTTPRHTVLLANADPRAPWLLRGGTDHPAALTALTASALLGADPDRVAAEAPGLALRLDPAPALLVCTNGRRDLCCAVRGRPVALAGSARRPGQVWETSHTGGHRYSPTGVLLPTGQTLARLDADLAVLALDGAAAGVLPVELHGPVHDRGRSGWAPPLQAAVSAVRERCGEQDYRALQARGQPVTAERWTVAVTHRDGRVWDVQVVRRVVGPERPASCVKPATPQVGWATSIR